MQREGILQQKNAGAPKPWTNDPILQQFRFCNVHREDDKVTIWIRDKWREPFKDHPNIYIAMILARLLNWPETLAELGFPKKWDYGRYLKVLQNRKMRGDRLHTGAYMVTAGGRPIPKEEAILDMVHGFHRSAYRPKVGDTLLYTWQALQSQGVSGMGSFLAAQIVADLKFVPLLKFASDWWTFCAPGPGSQIGLNHTLGLPLTKQWGRQEFEDHVNALREQLIFKLSAQDAQNCLCEFSKYKRGFSRSKYPGV
jgi:hypothetical protein